MDWRSLRVVPDDACSRARIARPAPGSELLLVQIELMREGDEDLAILGDVLGSAGVGADPVVAMPGDERGAERLVGLREAVPASVNARVALAKAAVHPDIRKTAVDPIVPVTRLAESLALYRAAFERRGLDYAVWGHLSDGNLHPNVIPRSMADVERGEEAIREIASGVIALGGSPLAEHGVGRSVLKQQLLHALYGDAGLAEMRAVKDALDPGGKLAPGVLFPSRGDIP
jgi:D-lactate dehydrogenase (cytochrome)